MSALIDYWPTQAQIDECIRTEAETVDDAVLLAVHQPGPLLARSAQTGKEESRNEKDLLEELLRPASDGSAVVVAITGASGVGKSHMVRWLHAQLQRHPDRDRWVIVLVPKTASLRQVVELVLAPLRGAGYDKLRAELSRAIENLTPKSASELLGTALAIELDERSKQWDEALRASGNSADRQARDRIFHANGLRGMLRDGPVFDRWFGAVLLRIVTQTLMGGSEVESGTPRRFAPTDFRVPEGCDISQATKGAQMYLARLETHDGGPREVAATVLQEVLDSALRTVFRFSEALGQRTIEEIVDEIRVQLLGEEKELVLLIEDFAALAGIQQPLLNLMIAESDHQGRRVRAPLRTALAVTDGFLPSRQTILTRAKQEWVIPSASASDTELLQRLTDLAGRYLNAARFGVTTLREQYSQQGNSSDDLYGWVQPFADQLSSEDADRLKAFGSSGQGFPLFPLSHLSIASLCQREMKSAGQLAFNPRAFINHVLRDTLSLRPLFDAGSFPPPAYKDGVLAADAEMALRSLPLHESVKARLATVLVHWAGNPPSLQALPMVERGVFDAFGVPWPYSLHGSKPPASPMPTGARPTPTPTPPSSPGTKGLSDELEAWAKGSLSEKTARNLRIVVAAALTERLDWNVLRLRRIPIPPAWIWLPFVSVGNPTADPKVVVADAVRPVSAVARLGLKALDRWNVNGRNWNYENAEDEYAVSQLLLDRLQPQVEAWLLNSARRDLATVLRTLHRQSLILGLSRKAEPSQVRPSELCAIAPAVTSIEFGPEDRNTQATQVTAVCDRARASRPQLQKLLVDSAGCFQGAGSQLYALDPIRLQAAWKEPEAEQAYSRIKVESDSGARESAQELGMVRLPVFLARYRAVVEPAMPFLRNSIGDDFNPSVWTLGMRKLLSTARRLSLVPERINMAQVERAIDSLAGEDVEPLVRRVVAFVAPEADRSIDVQLAGWTSIDVPLLAKIIAELKIIEAFLGGIDREADAALATSGGADTVEMLNQLHANLNMEAT